MLLLTCRCVLWIWLSVFIAGCGEVVTPAYPGESLAILRGVVLNPDGLQLENDVAAHLIWSSAPGSDTIQRAASTTFEARLPADFTLALYNPPPPEALEPTDVGVRARADVFVVTDNQLDALSNGEAVLGPYGRTALFTLLWLPTIADANAEQYRRQMTRPLVAGFNLLARSNDAAQAASLCPSCADGFDPVPLASVIALALAQDGT
jgi:hypothetical protein